MVTVVDDLELVVAELQALRRAGSARLRTLDLPLLAAAAGRLLPDAAEPSQPTSHPIRRLLVSATSWIDQGDHIEALRYSLGLVEGTATWTNARRRKRAATLLYKSVDTYRKRIEPGLLADLATAIIERLSLIGDSSGTGDGSDSSGTMQHAPARGESDPSERIAKRRIEMLLATAESALYQATTERNVREREAPLNDTLLLLANNHTPEARVIKARAIKLLADIRRDRGRLVGPRGAFSMYRQCRELLKGLREPILEIELILVEASCMEMSGLTDLSIKHFAVAEAAAGDRHPWFRSWAQLRRATNLTKVGYPDEASEAMRKSFASADGVASSSWRAEQLMKLSSLNLAQGQFALAVQNARDAQAMTDAPSSLTIVRQSVQLADALYHDRMLTDAQDVLASARALASNEGYLHQLRAIARLETRFPDARPLQLAAGSASLFTPLQSQDILGDNAGD